MTWGVSELNLEESYDFPVVIASGADRFAGELSLTPRKLSLRVMGERTDERRYQLPMSSDLLACEASNGYFILVGVEFRSGGWRMIEHYPKPRSFFEDHFEVEHALYLTTNAGGRPDEIRFFGLELQANAIAEWVGNTKKQEQILAEYERGGPLFGDPSLLYEFVAVLGSEDRLGVVYNLSTFYSSPEFKAGVTFPPSLNAFFASSKTPAQALSFFYELYALFAFLIGDELDLKKILLSYTGVAGLQRKASVYCPRERTPGRRRDPYVLFPLSRNLRFDTQRLLPVPLELFNAYFALDAPARKRFDKYVRYRRLQNVEERFLGYFRLLEALCHSRETYFDEGALVSLARRAKPYLTKKFGDAKAVRSFIRHLPWFNTLRHTTEKRIGDFFETIPTTESERWKFERGDLAAVCKLRNDITHANHYAVKAARVEEMAYLIEVLLVLKFLLQLGVEMSQGLEVVRRLPRYRWILKPAPTSSV